MKIKDQCLQWGVIISRITQRCAVPQRHYQYGRGPKSEGTAVPCRCTDELEKQLSALCYCVIK